MIDGPGTATRGSEHERYLSTSTTEARGAPQRTYGQVHLYSLTPHSSQAMQRWLITE